MVYIVAAGLGELYHKNMIYFGHNASLNKIDGVHVLDKDPKNWGPLVPKAEYLSQFGKIKAWEIYILPFQLRPQALEQLALAMTMLAEHESFADLEWLSFHFPTTPQSHHTSAEINQEQWRPFYQLLQVLDRFTGAKQKILNVHILAEATLAQVWLLEKKHDLADAIKQFQESAKGLLEHAYKLRNHVNPKLGLTVENNPPYNDKTHSFHLAGMFPQELRRWQLVGLEVCLDIQHASLVHWYRERYGYDGPIPPLNELHHRSTLGEYLDLEPRYLHVAGAPDTAESFHVGSTVGADDDDVDWKAWMTDLKKINEKRDLPVIIELVGGHLPENFPACQSSAAYLKNLL